MKRLVLAVIAGSLIGCTAAGPEGADTEAWVGTITTEGSVTTVVNESGSVWGGTATLVEEASIGVDAGPPEYMLASVVSVAATDNRIYVLERRPPILRVYDFDGTHVQDIGGRGQGPGEFGLPASVTIAPDGRILVRDEGNTRFSVFDRDGELLETWPKDARATLGETVLAPDGTPYVPVPFRVPGQRRVIGYRAHGAEGAFGEPVMPREFAYEEPRLRSGGSSGPVPYWPRPVSILSPVGAMVSGLGIEYAIEVRYFDGRVRRIVRQVPPVPVSADEVAWRERAETAYWKGEDPSWRWAGPGVRDEKPYFDGLYADADGRIWVERSGPSVRVADCDENPVAGASVTPCWRNTTFIEVFGADGRFLGEADFPRYRGFQSNFIRGDTVIRRVEDEAGTIMVKRYRLVLPGEAGE